MIGPPPAHILETVVDDDISLYDPRSEQVLVLNGTASDIWRLSDGEHDIEGMTLLLAEAYGVEPEAIRDQVVETIRTFTESGFLPNSQ